MTTFTAVLARSFKRACFHQNAPLKAFLRVVLRVRVDKRLVTRSAPNMSDERRKVPNGRSRVEVRSDPDGSGQGGGKFTKEQMDVHVAHTEACEAKKQMYVDPSSGYKVFTEYAHLQRGKCCGSACRHCPYGHVNVKDPAMKKRFNSLYYV